VVFRVFALALLLLAQDLQQRQLGSLPETATRRLAEGLAAASKHAKHVWRDTPPLNDDQTVNAYIEIARGDRRKWEFDMGANARRIDRMIPSAIGGYAVNYGFVPRTISSDGDPFDALVLGPPLKGGTLVRGVVVGLMFMEDEKGPDSKVVLSIPDRDGRPRYQLTAAAQHDIADYFKRYKQGQPGMFSKVPGWGSIADGMAHVKTTHAFFLGCRERAGEICTLH
jgi:inorganic pyrophosphatase